MSVRASGMPDRATAAASTIQSTCRDVKRPASQKPFPRSFSITSTIAPACCAGIHLEEDP
jgi:hypothetical protein